MKKVKSIIVDDEILARRRISKLLYQDDEIEIAGEFEKGADAIHFMNQNQVDIIFLDIHMPEVDGFTVLKKLSPEFRPFIIFVTADKESAIKAFEYNAIDYLLKPFRNGRFFDSLNKAKKYVHLKNKASVNDQLTELLSGISTLERSQKLLIDKQPEIDFNDVLFIKADGNYLKVYENRQDFRQIRLTLNELDEQLGNSDFLRIHRSVLVNTYFIETVDYIGNNEYEFHISGGIVIKSGRSYKQEIDTFISNSRQ